MRFVELLIRSDHEIEDFPDSMAIITNLDLGSPPTPRRPPSRCDGEAGLDAAPVHFRPRWVLARAIPRGTLSRC
jgi:hypothetical protein